MAKFKNTVASGRAAYAYKCVQEDVVQIVENPNLWKFLLKRIIREKLLKDKQIKSLAQQLKDPRVDVFAELANLLSQNWKQLSNNTKNDNLDKKITELINNKFKIKPAQKINTQYFIGNNIKTDALENELIKRIKEDRINYKSYVKKVPMYILTNGLAATFAFAKSKNKVAWDIIYYQTQEWLRRTGKIEKDDLMEGILALNSQKYRIATKETLALFSWLRRFAEGLIEGEENEG